MTKKEEMEDRAREADWFRMKYESLGMKMFYDGWQYPGDYHNSLAHRFMADGWKKAETIEKA
jgi:hypothetical protein